MNKRFKKILLTLLFFTTVILAGRVLAANTTTEGKISVNKVCLDNFELPVVTYTRKKPIQISFGLVCSTEELVYMNVSPETVQWLTPDMGIIYEVTSNVNWQIDY